MGAVEGVMLTDVQWSSVRDDAGAAHPRLVCLSWTCALGSSTPFVVQAYVDGVPAGATGGPGERSLIIGMDRHRNRVVHLLAVSVADRLTDYSDQLDSSVYGVRLGVVRVTREENWPEGASVGLEIDSAASAARPVWIAIENRPGFGSFFGTGDFGFDGAAGLGLGEFAPFGDGPFRFDAVGIRWMIDEEMSAGSVGQVVVKDVDGAVVERVNVDLPVIGPV